MCLYADDRLILSALAPKDASCAGAPCWKTTARRFRYRNTDLTPDGLATIVLRTGKAGGIAVRGRGVNLGAAIAPADDAGRRAAAAHRRRGVLGQRDRHARGQLGDSLPRPITLAATRCALVHAISTACKDDRTAR